MTAVQLSNDLYLSNFEQRIKAGTCGPDWFAPTRRAALNRFLELGFPTPRHEEWRYTNVAPIASAGFCTREPGSAQVTREDIAAFSFGVSVCVELVFVDGWLCPELSSRGAVPAGVRVASLVDVMETDRSLVEPHLARHANFEEHAFAALNTALMQDGALVYVPRHSVVEQPIHLLFVSTGGGPASASHPRNLVMVDADSQATVIESYVGLGASGEAAYLTNPVTEVVASENAVVDHYKLNLEHDTAYHVGTLNLHQFRASNVRAHTASCGGVLVRNDINAILDAEGCECELDGVTMIRGRQHVDNHLRVEHAKPHSNSREFFKGILDDQARSVFTGRIVVQPDAQKTDAKQTNMNLLLGPGAQADSKPQLEIFADDVKCTHGATIGQVDEEAIFYLRSRGLSEPAARGLLVHAFAGEAIDRVRFEPLRSRLDELSLARLPHGAALRESIG